MTDRTLIVPLAVCAGLAGLIAFEFMSDEANRPGLAATPARFETATAQPAERPKPDDLAVIVASPLFSTTRHPSEPSETAAAAEPDLKNIRLTGIVVQPDSRMAIFAIAGAKPMIRSEGESVMNWRLDRILPDEVSLSGPLGSRTFEPKPDQNLVRPSLPAAAKSAVTPSNIRARPAPGPSQAQAVPPAQRLAPMPPTGQPATPISPRTSSE